MSRAFAAAGLVPPPVSSLSGLPAATRAIGLIAGLIRQMSLDAYDVDRLLPRPRLLERPDPTAGRAWWVGLHVEDYLLHGNALHLVTVRDQDGVPLAVEWLPAQWVGITRDRDPFGRGGQVQYWLHGHELPAADVVHVRRGADRWEPARGVGVIEQHLTTVHRLGRQAQFEADAYDRSGVPSVAVITPNSHLSPEEAEAAKTTWMERFVRREPVILPSGSEVKPLAWSPSDSQMVEAHQMSLQDVANMFGLDGSWLGAPLGGMTYKSIGPLFLGLVRETLDPITDDLEQAWGDAWLPMGQSLRFAKREILTDDPSTEMEWLDKALGRGLIDEDEARERLGYPARRRGSALGVEVFGESVPSDAETARAAAEVAQKVYLAAPKDEAVLTREEARRLVARAGGVLGETMQDARMAMAEPDEPDETAVPELGAIDKPPYGARDTEAVDTSPTTDHLLHEETTDDQ